MYHFITNNEMCIYRSNICSDDSDDLMSSPWKVPLNGYNSLNLTQQNKLIKFFNYFDVYFVPSKLSVLKYVYTLYVTFCKRGLSLI